MRTKLEERVAEVERAARRLAATGTMGDRARRNARAALAKALRGVRGAADEAFPPPKREQGKRRTPSERLAAMRREGWDDVTYDSARIVDLAHRSIRVVKITLTFDSNGASHSKTMVFAPPWTKDVPAEKLEAARRSHQKAQAFKALTKMQRAPAVQS